MPRRANSLIKCPRCFGSDSWQGSSVGQSIRFIPVVSRVQISPLLPECNPGRDEIARKPAQVSGFFFWLCHSIWLFHLHSTVKIRPFSPFSPWRNPCLGYFIGYSFGISRNKASTIFYDTALRNCARQEKKRVSPYPLFKRSR